MTGAKVYFTGYEELEGLSMRFDDDSEIDIGIVDQKSKFNWVDRSDHVNGMYFTIDDGKLKGFGLR